MGLFDRISEDEEEVVLTEPEEIGANEEETRLKSDLESSLGSSSKSSTSSSSSRKSSSRASSSSSNVSSSLPGMSSSASTSKSIEIEDLHDQNKKIIGLLKDIKSELSGGNELLR
jgi:hypothetical protein